MDKLKTLILENISRLKNIDTNEDSVQYIKMFTPTILALSNMDFFDLILAFYMAKYNATIQEALTEKNKIIGFLEEINNLEYDDVLNLVDIFYDIKQEYGNELGNFTYDDYMSIRNNDKIIKDTKKLLKGYITIYTKQEINDFLRWLNDDELSDIICIASSLKGIKKQLDQIPETLNDIEIPKILKSRITKKISNNYIKGVNNSYLKSMDEELKDDLELLKNFKNKLISDNVSVKRSINKKIQKLEKLYGLIDNENVTVEQLFKLTDNEEIIYYALIQIIKIRNVEFENNYVNLLNCKNNPVNILEKLFHDYGYNFNALNLEEQNRLMRLYKIEKIRENLSFISNSSLKFLREDDEAFYNILILDIESLTQLDSLLSRGKINTDFILKHGHMLDANIINRIIRNINKLDVYKVNINDIISYNSNLVIDLNNDLFDMITLYGIDFKSSNLKYYEFLEEIKLLNLIDEFIEIGLYTQISSLPNLINSSSKNVIKRIILMNELGENYLNERNTINQKARNGKDFYLGDDLLGEYVVTNYIAFMNEEMLKVININANTQIIEQLPEPLKFIEEYKKNDQIYMIGSKYFSRIKVLRILKTLIDNGFTNYNEMLFNALIYNYPMYLNLEEIKELKELGENILKKQLK